MLLLSFNDNKTGSKKENKIPTYFLHEKQETF